MPGASDDVIFDNHANGDTPCTLSANTTIKSLVMTGWANTLTHNDDVTLTVEGTVTLASDMTYTANATNTRITMTETATLTTAGIVLSRLTFSGSDKTITLGDNLTLAGSGSDTLVLSSDTEFTHNDKKVTLTGDSPRINGTFTFYDLTIEGNNSSTAKVELTDNITVDNTLKIDGYSAKNRVQVRSSAGVQRTITAAVVSVSNIALYQIKGAGDGS